jgi:hypothetical protein
MFSRLKKALTGSALAPKAAHSTVQQSRLSEWASLQGYELEGDDKRAGFSLSGRVGRKAWRLESGRPSRDFIHGEEIRARADLGLDQDIAVMVVNRPLKEALEQKAYAEYTDALQTTVDASMPEEVRWLTMFEEVRSSAWGPQFAQQLVVVAQQPDQALRWLDATLGHELLHWPSELTVPDTPMVLMIMRGKLYLRMQYTPADIPTLEHAVRVFVWACESALSAFSVDIQS